MIGLPFEVPVDLGRDEARELAERELAKPEFTAALPPLPERILRWIAEWIGDLLRGAADISPGGYGGLAVFAILIVLAVIAIRLRVGRVGRNTSAAGGLFGTTIRSAADHRAAADAHAAAGAWADAVRERLRAIVRGLEERDLLDARAGRTADEAAAEAGRILPECAAGLRSAAVVFDDVWYGGRQATPAMDAQLRALDESVQQARPAVGALR
ncbi:DUF4129 domain-containing protein [Pseudonocardia sp. TRM90224]|uniref:DUF4129 domain-containing protein n=1 Tax=Pseudonocardia sp. TRM90224 TaxID=2812678 RepID=UPI001E2E470A|nr:DUF4129 domain-containing protein [Pseudonocardia sp. TRM90224]